ncbi:MAG: LysR family transcriptional regulator [Pedosphaera sp.]|nr:LysR family transcriptional regulator [Pedosphaera sp.]
MKNPLDSRQLQAFVTLANNGSFTQTARDLFLTQSAISHAMKALEGDVGCRLLDRLGKKVTLTQAGEQLLQHAERILAEMTVARSGLEQLGKWGHSRLKLAAPAALCVSLLPTVLRSLQTEYPKCGITIEPCDSLVIMEILDDGRAELAVTLETKPEERFQFEPLFQDELQFIAAPEHPWARTGQIPRAEISRQQVIIYGKQSLTWRLIDDYFQQDHITLNTVIELGSTEAIKELVKLNLGVGIVAPWAISRELKEGSLLALPLGRRKLRRPWGVLRLRSHRLAIIEERFITLCRTAAGQLPGTEQH